MSKPERELKPEQTDGGTPPSGRGGLPNWIWLLALAIGMMWWGMVGRATPGHPISYSRFKASVALGEVVDAVKDFGAAVAGANR